MQVSADAAEAGPVEARDTYDRFAFAYDAFTADYAYERWFAQLARLAADHGLTGHRVLDVACGTGKSFLPWLEQGYEVTACDISEQMLERAARKAPQARVFRADLRALPRAGEFDLVTCVDDGLNYLGSASELVDAMAGIERNLAPHGLAMWDVNTLAMYRTEFASHRAIENDGLFMVWQGGARADHGAGEAVSAVVDVFRESTDGRWERTRSTHLQRHWSPETVHASADAANLRVLAVRGQRPGARLEGDLDEHVHTKAVFVACREDRRPAEEVSAMHVGSP